MWLSTIVLRFRPGFVSCSKSNGKLDIRSRCSSINDVGVLGGIKDFVTLGSDKAFALHGVLMEGEGLSKIINNCVTSFMDDL
jgi:hypothetical protein